MGSGLMMAQFSSWGCYIIINRRIGLVPLFIPLLPSSLPSPLHSSVAPVLYSLATVDKLGGRGDWSLVEGIYQDLMHSSHTNRDSESWGASLHWTQPTLSQMAAETTGQWECDYVAQVGGCTPAGMTIWGKPERIRSHSLVTGRKRQTHLKHEK